MHKVHENLIQDLALLHERGQLGQAYIFFGDPGIGKAAAALALAEQIETGTRPEEDARRTLTDAQVFSLDEKGIIGIDAARSIKAFLAERPFIGSRRTAIIDRAEKLTPEAQNALLKIAEEPPRSALLILVTPDPEILWPTLQSRFQKIYFPPLARQDMLNVLETKRNPLAARFFKTAPAARKDFIKELTAPEDFIFTDFLDSLIAHLAAEISVAEGLPSTTFQNRKVVLGRLWHAVLELRRMQDATSLSPRIQLMNLWTLT